MRVLFFGTPQIAVPYLEWLTSNAIVAGVVCRPDQPVGRGYALTAPPTKQAAVSLNIPVFQPEGPWTDETIQQLKALNADIGIVVAYGRILPAPVFTAPKLGCVNIHFSLLPKYRGAAPMQWALINGEKKTGVSAFWLEAGLDSGPLFHQAEAPIAAEDNAATLQEKLVPLGVSVMEKVIRDAEAGQIRRDPQVGEPSLAPQLKKETGRIDWTRSPREIVNLVRGVSEWPVASTSFMHKGEVKQLKVLKAAVHYEMPLKAHAGAVLEVKTGIVVAAGRGTVMLQEVQPEGKKPMAAIDFWRGAHMEVGETLGRK